MKKNKILLVMPLLSVFTLVNCGGKTPEPTKTLDSITASLPLESYKIGETISKRTFNVTAKYSDSTTKSVTNYVVKELTDKDSYTFTQEDVTAKSKTFNVTYKEGDISKDTSVTVTVRDLDGTCNETQWKNAFSHLYDVDEKTNYTMVKTVTSNDEETYKIDNLTCEYIADDKTKTFEKDFHKTKLFVSEDNVELKSKTTTLMQDKIKELVDVCKTSYSKAKYTSDGKGWGSYEAKDIKINEITYSFTVTIDKNYKIAKIVFLDDLKEEESKSGTYEFKDYGTTKLDEIISSKYVLESEKDSSSNIMTKTFNVDDDKTYYVGLSLKNATNFDPDNNTVVVNLTNSSKSVVTENDLEVYLDGNKIKSDDYTITGSGDTLGFKFNAGTIYINKDSEMIFCFSGMTATNNVVFNFDYSKEFNGEMTREEMERSLTYLFESIDERKQFKCYLDGEENSNYFIGNGEYEFYYIKHSEGYTDTSYQFIVDGIRYNYQIENNQPYITNFALYPLLRKFTKDCLHNYAGDASSLNYNSATKTMKEDNEYYFASLKFSATGHLINFEYEDKYEKESSLYHFKYNEGTINKPTKFSNFHQAEDVGDKLQYGPFDIYFRKEGIFITGKIDESKKAKKIKLTLTMEGIPLDILKAGIDIEIATPFASYDSREEFISFQNGSVILNLTNVPEVIITDFCVKYDPNLCEEKYSNVVFNCEVLNS